MRRSTDVTQRARGLWSRSLSAGGRARRALRPDRPPRHRVRRLGRPAGVADVGVRGDRIVAVGDLSKAEAAPQIDATGLAVAPGFINMLSWATESLLVDGRVAERHPPGRHARGLGRGRVDGPAQRRDEEGDRSSSRATSSIDDRPGRRSASTSTRSSARASRPTSPRSSARPRCASTSSATTIASPPPRSWSACGAGAPGDGGGRARRRLVADLRAGASTPRPTSWSRSPRRPREYGGMYISHMRSEGNRLLEAVDELIAIAREAQRAGRDLPPQGGGPRRTGASWTPSIAKVEAARAAGLDDHRRHVHLHRRRDRARRRDAALGAGGRPRSLARAAAGSGDPRAGRAARCARRPTPGRTCCLLGRRAERILLVGFKNDALKPLTGKTLAEVAKHARQVARRRRRWTWSSRTTAGSARSTS